MIDADAEDVSPPGRNTNGTLVATLAFWNPALAAVITFMFATSHVLVYWLATLVIADFVALELYAAGLAGRALMRWIRRTRDQPPTPGRGWSLFWPMWPVLVLPAALPLGFRAGARTAAAYGVYFGPHPQGTTLASYGFSWGPDLRSYCVAIGFGLAMMMLFAIQRTRSEARERAGAAEARVKDLEAARLAARVSALTSEMNPHFLFNALNTVASLVHCDPERAEDVVVQLSELYRRLLRSSGASTHTLEQELAICEAYLRLEQARFGDRLTVDVAIDPAIAQAGVQVPILVLQPFVENAVTHGLSSRARGGRLSVRVHMGPSHVELCVEDDGVGLGGSSHKGSGKAIANCKDRLRLTYGSAAHLDVTDRANGGTRVLVRIPASATDAKEPS